MLPAGQVTPSPKPYSEAGQELRLVDRMDWTAEIKAVAGYIERVGTLLVGSVVTVRVASDISWPFAGTYGGGLMTLNLGRLGHKWFAGPLTAINDLVLHELGHHASGNHLSSEYHDALTLLGAKLTDLALTQPKLFRFRPA